MNTEVSEIEHGHPRRWSILVALCAALLIIVVDNTVLSVALPAIGQAFAVETPVLQAVVDAYVVVFAGLLVASGAASDRFGRRRTMLVGLVVFAVASAAAAAASSVWWLVGMRGLMGVGAALVMPATLAVLVQVFPAAERPRAFAAWAAVASVAMTIGPVLGGALVAGWSWAGVFLINIPVVVVALVGVARLVPESRDPDPHDLDAFSTVLITLGLGGLTLAVIVVGEAGPAAPSVLAGAAVAVLGLGGFGWRQHRASAPMVDFSLYRNRAFAGGSAAVAILTVGTGSALFVLTQYLQLVLGYNAWETGLAVMPLAIGVVVGSAVGARAPTRFGARRAVAVGFFIITAGFIALATLGPSSSYLRIGTGLLLLGLGAGISGPGVTSTVLGAVPRHRAGMGAALNDTHQQLGIAIGVAALGSLLATTYRAELPSDFPGGVDGPTAALLLDAGTSRVVALARNAFAQAQTTTMLAAAGTTLIGASIALIALPRDHTR